MTDEKFLDSLVARGFDFLAEVPCTITSGFHNKLTTQNNLELFSTYHEHNLPGLATGHFLATGRPAVILMQNSGFPNAYDGLLTCVKLYAIPVLVLVTWRGDLPSDTSEPHQLIGEATDPLTRSLGFPVFGNRDSSNFATELEHALDSVTQGNPTILRIASNVLGPASAGTEESIRVPAPAPQTDARAQSEAPNRDAALTYIRGRHPSPNTVFLFSNGYTSRAAAALSTEPNRFYNIGYMGGTMAIGYALARRRPALTVVVVDGDQNAEMSCMKDHVYTDCPSNLHYYIIDNGHGASVGNTKSIPLPAYYSTLAEVIRVPRDTSPFTYPRVSPDRFSELLHYLAQERARTS